ncbi:MAG: cyclomaltodextrinase N-terminal domain-containing protein, partial [Pyrinomonadaceae bacterium]|nr:cyclomaltodextrinase N-terminal domain-containing protein [Pyrinomonadaceae bacterium]
MRRSRSQCEHLQGDHFALKSLGSVVCFFVAAVAVCALPQSGTPSVTKVEPPSWWARHTFNPVRLLVRGKNLQGARVRATRTGTRVSNVVVNQPGSYVFLDVNIHSSARPGSYPLVVETPQGETTIPFAIGTTLDPQRNFLGISNDDVIYLIMPDRFADGDQSNNAPPGASAAANDRQNPRGYHGGDLRGIINNLPYLKELGVTALWLTPWYDNWNGVNTCERPWCPNTYYHGYH